MIHMKYFECECIYLVLNLKVKLTESIPRSVILQITKSALINMINWRKPFCLLICHF